MCAICMDIALKQIVKSLDVLFILKNFSGQRTHSLIKKDGQSTYIVTLRRLHLTIVSGGKNEYFIFWECVCSLSYSACIPHVPIIMCGLSGCAIFFYVIHKRYDFRKVIERKIRVLIFSTNLSEIFLIVRRSEQDMIITVYRSSHKIPVILIMF
jgi:hypothetical protein